MILLDHLSCQERLDLIARHAESLVLISLTTDGTIVDWSIGAQSMFGWTHDEIVGKSIVTIFTASDVAAAVPEKELEHAKAHGSAPDTRWLVRKDGSKVFVDGEITALRRPGGELLGFAKTLRDATAILNCQQSDATLRAMINATPHMVWSADAEGHVDYFNEKMVEFIGQPAESLLGNGWTNFVHPDDRAAAWEKWLDVNQTWAPLSIEFRFRNHTGQYHWVLCRGEPVFDQTSGELIRWMGTNTDIHEQKVANEALRDARQRLQATLSAGNIGTWNFDLVAHKLYADEHMRRLFGVDGPLNAAFDPEVFFAAIHPDDVLCVRDRISQALTATGAFAATYRVVQPGGEVRHVHARGKVEFDADRKPLWLPGVVIDVTELRVSQEELRVREERYRTLFNSIDDGFLIIELIFEDEGQSTDHRFVEANAPVAVITGLDLPGKLASEVNFELSLEFRAKYAEAWATGQPVTGVVEHPKTQRWIDYSIMRLGGRDGHQVAMFLRDITERKRSEHDLRQREERYRALFNSIEQGFAIIELLPNADGQVIDYRFLEVNPALEQITGLKDVVGKRLREVVPQPNMYWVARYADVARTGEAAHWTDYSAALEGWYDLSVLPIDAVDRNQVALLFKDVTETRRNDEAVKQLAEDLAKVNLRQREFLATLAHELRNPLAPIRSGLEVLGLAINDPQKVERIRELMTRQVSHLTHLVDELLDVARISSGKIALKLESVVLANVVEQAVEAVSPLMRSKNHYFTLDLPTEPISFMADPNRLVQVLVNLLANAAKYTPPRGSIRLHAERDDNAVIVTVIDDGIGIESAALPHIFDIFNQVADANDLSEGGLGIGLNLVKRLVEKHGGSVAVASLGKGRGAEFTIRLPIDSRATPAQLAPA